MEQRMCRIHNVEMRQYEKDGRTWFSHKADEGWCNGMVKPNQTIQQVTKPENRTYQGRPQIEWDNLGNVKAICGMVNGMLSAGVKPSEINIEELGEIVEKINHVAERKTKDLNPPIF